MIELLVVVAVIAILAGLLLPALGRAKVKVRQSGCLSNLRQVGTAVTLWVDDHDGWLPPGENSPYGLWAGQRPGYRESQNYKYNLAYYLSTYLGYPPPDNQVRAARVFFCPGFERYGRNVTNIDDRTVYVRTIATANGLEVNGLYFDPFGYPPADGQAPRPPGKLSLIERVRALTDVWLLADADQVSINNPGNTWRPQLPDKPVHGSVRNFIYFDNHVATRKVGPPGTF